MIGADQKTFETSFFPQEDTVIDFDNLSDPHQEQMEPFQGPFIEP
jgi:hypothetical protein